MMRAYSSFNNQLLTTYLYAGLKSTLHLVLLSILFYAPYINACKLSLQGLDDIHVVFNHAYSNKSVAGRIAVEQFSVHNSGVSCNFFVSFSNTSNSQLINNRGQKLNYRLYDSIQHNFRLDGEFPIQTNNILAGKLNKHQPLASLNYYLHIPYNPNAPAGIYSNSANISVYEGTITEHILHDTQRVHYYAVIPTDVSVSISSRSNVDFGTLQIGESRSFSVDVAANTPYDISIESENKGYLTHNSNRSPSVIPYRLQHHGRHINLNHATIISHSKRNYQREVTRYEFDAVIEEFDFVLSGKYQDNIIFTVTAR